jgi:hypothetical protein
MSDPQRPEREAMVTLDAVLTAIAAEEELDGPLPEAMRAKFLADPEGALRSAVRATKYGISIRVRQLAALPPTPTPGEAKLLERIADLERQLAWERKRGDYLRGRAASAEFREGARLPTIADPDVPPAPTGERE